MQESLSGFGIAVQIAVISLFETNGGECCVTEKVIISVVDHVLKDNHAQSVAIIIELLGFHLDVLSQSIESQRLHGEDVFFVADGICGSEKTVAPIALIKKSVEKVRLSVETKPLDAIDFFAAQGTKSKVGLNGILTGLNCAFVKIGIFRGPQSGRCQFDSGCILNQRKLEDTFGGLDRNKTFRDISVHGEFGPVFSGFYLKGTDV